MSTRVIPVFPMRLVLFPGTLIRLRFGEAPYKALISAALAEYEGCFGVSLIGGDCAGVNPQPHTIGTLARILHVQRDDDGNIHLFAIGRERFRVLSFHQSDQFLMAVIEEAPLRAVMSPAVEALEKKARPLATEYFQTLLALIGQDTEGFHLPSAVIPLAHFVASNMQVSLTRRQHLLEINDLESLLGEEIRLMADELKRIQWMETQKRMRPRGPAHFSLN